MDEGEEAVFTVRLSGQVSTEVPVGYQTEAGTAGAGDYVAVTNGEVTIAVGETSATFTIDTTDESPALAEASETFSVLLADVLNEDLPVGVAIDTASATATIRDDEELKVSITAGPQTVNVGATSAVYTVTLEGGTGTAPIMVSYRDGSRTGTATITTGRASTTIDIDPSARTKNQTFTVELTGATTSNGRVSVDRSNNEHRVTTRVIDPTDETVFVSVDSATLTEAEGQSADFTVARSQPLTIQTVVRYTVSGSATAGRDYTGPSSGTLTIPANEIDAVGSITVNVLDDMLAENAETIEVTLTEQNSPDLTLGTAAVSTTIQTNDALTARVKRQGPTVLEGSATTFTVELTQTIGGAPGAGSEDVVVRLHHRGQHGDRRRRLHGAEREADDPRRADGGYDRDSDACRRRAGNRTRRWWLNLLMMKMTLPKTLPNLRRERCQCQGQTPGCRKREGLRTSKQKY